MSSSQLLGYIATAFIVIVIPGPRVLFRVAFTVLKFLGGC
jgi:threonine/homoserine/homoserine lactone efflux protein